MKSHTLDVRIDNDERFIPLEKDEEKILDSMHDADRRGVNFAVKRSYASESFLTRVGVN